MKIAIGGQLDKALILEKIVQISELYPDGNLKGIVKSDIEAALMVKNGEADYYFGSCATGAGGSLAGAIAMLGYENCSTISMPGKAPNYDNVLTQVKNGKKAFGFTNNHIDEGVSFLIKAIMDNR